MDDLQLAFGWGLVVMGLKTIGIMEEGTARDRDAAWDIGKVKIRGQVK
jgi:hypothetical protein